MSLYVISPRSGSASSLVLVSMATAGDDNEAGTPPQDLFRRSESAPPPVQNTSLVERLYASFYRFKYGKYINDLCVVRPSQQIVLTTGRMFNSSIQMSNTPIIVLGNCFIPDKGGFVL